ncbi:hypothetical protein QBC37DRAFT_404908 [Rhypophila decipiens]|uniref:Uncharacterized protein n=1 Tax=Rhypophila decipiens TaxID=261697 RepID=A0AAN6XY38_9PEZI|nr:hypothetical protein QBC37DRAFT_404908 [Rhypophila decipiens]
MLFVSDSFDGCPLIGIEPTGQTSAAVPPPPVWSLAAAPNIIVVPALAAYYCYRTSELSNKLGANPTLCQFLGRGGGDSSSSSSSGSVTDDEPDSHSESESESDSYGPQSIIPWSEDPHPRPIVGGPADSRKLRVFWRMVHYLKLVSTSTQGLADVWVGSTFGLGLGSRWSVLTRRLLVPVEYIGGSAGWLRWLLEPLVIICCWSSHLVHCRRVCAAELWSEVAKLDSISSRSASLKSFKDALLPEMNPCSAALPRSPACTAPWRAQRRRSSRRRAGGKEDRKLRSGRCNLEAIGSSAGDFSNWKSARRIHGLGPALDHRAALMERVLEVDPLQEIPVAQLCVVLPPVLLHGELSVADHLGGELAARKTGSAGAGRGHRRLR